jgi:murein DD-endopeptidase MepM/ murein hydrolase activator NlpD
MRSADRSAESRCEKHAGTRPFRTDSTELDPLPLRRDPRATHCMVTCLAFVAAMVALVGCGDNPTVPRQSERDQCLARAVFGDPASSPYILPYPVGTSYRLLQTYCGPQNHGRDNQLAYDFTMPFGDPVVAARSGMVRRVVDTYADDDSDRSHHNHMFIEHEDGTTAFYAHLVQHSVVAQEGDWVERGQLIALSGTSGGTVAVLHFGVYRTWPVRGGDDVAVTFCNAEGILDERGGLQQGAVYTALPF